MVSRKFIAFYVLVIIVIAGTITPITIFLLNQETNTNFNGNPETDIIPIIETITVGEIDLTFRAFLWRDFSLIYPSYENGTGLIAVIYL